MESNSDSSAPEGAAEGRDTAPPAENVPATMIVQFGIAFALCISGVILYAAIKIDGKTAVNLLVAAAGALAGHLIGVLLSPFSAEKDEFTGIRRALGTFISGYGLAKLDSLAKFFSDPARISQQALPMVGDRLLLFFSGMTLMVIVVFGARRYVAKYPHADHTGYRWPICRLWRRKRRRRPATEVGL